MNTQRADVDPIRVRIMQEAYDLADRNDSEGYNSVKVMCSDVLALVEKLIAATRAAEREACAKLFERLSGTEWLAENVADEIRARR